MAALDLLRAQALAYDDRPMKTFFQFASNAVPLLARLLLCVAFLPSGWHHAMNWTEFQGTEAQRLRELGVASAVTHVANETTVQLKGEPQPTSPTEFTAVLQARSLHELTLEFDAKGMPRPFIAAWTISVIELLGGAMLLIGLFSRIWAAGIAFWAIALFGLSGLIQNGLWNDLWTTTAAARASTLGLLTIATLALGIVFKGAGSFSLDAMIFRRGAGKDGGGKSDGK
jgi:putative oxidoreductase